MRKTSDVSLHDYICKFKSICDKLANIGTPLHDRNKVFSLPNILGPKYEPFTAAMLKPPMSSCAEIIPLLQSYETCLTLNETETTAHVAFYSNKNQHPKCDSRPRQGSFQKFHSQQHLSSKARVPTSIPNNLGPTTALASPNKIMLAIV